MKILIMTGTMNIGGIEKALIDFLHTADPSKYEITLLLESIEGEYIDQIPDYIKITTDDNLNLYLYSSRRKQLTSMMKTGKIASMFNLLYESFIYKVSGNTCRYYNYQCSRLGKLNGKYDIAVAYHNPFRFPGNYILNNVNARYKILWNHTDILYNNHPEREIIPYRDFYNRYDKILCVSDAARKSFITVFPEFTSKSETFYNTVNIKRIRQQAEEYIPSYKNGKPILLTVGRLSPEKGQNRIPVIANLLRMKGWDFQWIVIGDGILRSEIEQKREEFHLQDYIELKGYLGNPYPYMRICDIYVQTSWQEGLPMVLGEVQIFNKPCVVTDVGGTREYFQCGGGIIVEENTEERISAAIYQMLTNKDVTKHLENEIKKSKRITRTFDDLIALCCR